MKMTREMLFVAMLVAAAHGVARGAARDVVRASEFGFNPTNATACLQAAIDSRAKTVVVDRQASNWLVGPIAMRSGQEVVLENGVVVEAVPDGYKGRADMMFNFRNVRRSSLRGLGRAVLKMRKADYQDASRYETSEWRNVVGMFNVRDVSVSNLVLAASGGDGVYISNGFGVYLDGLTVTDNRRQGLSLISADGVVVRNCVFAMTDGCPPGAGIDFEPNEAREGLSNILVENCAIYGNNGYGLDFHLDALRSSSRPFSAVVRNCRVYGNASYGLKLSMGTTDPVRGSLSFEECTFSGNGKSELFFRNQYDGRVAVSFDKCAFDARGCDGAAVEIQNSTRFDPFGGVSFRYVDLVADAAQEKIRFSALPGAGAENVVGNLDLLYGAAPRDIVPAVAEMGLPRHDPELDALRVEPIDRAALKPLRGQARGTGGMTCPWLRGSFTFLQYVPCAGKYPIVFRLGQVGRGTARAEVRVTGPGGEALRGFRVPPEAAQGKFSYALEAEKPGVYAFEVFTYGHVAAIDSPFPGQGFDAARGFSPMGGRPNGRPFKFYFRVPAGEKDVWAQVVPDKGEPVAARLLGPDGKVAAASKEGDAPSALHAVRAKADEAETWCLELVRAREDVYVAIGGDGSHVVATDPELVFDAPGVAGDEAAREAKLAKAMDEAWNGIFRHNFNPVTKIVYDGPQQNLPTPAEIAANFPNICGWNTGMEDGPLNGAPLLLAALARWNASGGVDAEAARRAQDVFEGLVRCAEVSGVPGFVARGVCPADGRSFYKSSSRDQYTLFVYAMWRALKHPFSEKAGWRPRIRRLLADVAAYCAKGVTAASGWNVPRADGGEPLVSQMWTSDPKGRPDGRGSRDFGGLSPHETTRLPMVYAAAWDATGDARWKREYEKYVDDAIAMSEYNDPASERVFAILQMHVANLLIMEVDPDAARRERLRRIVERRMRWALAVSCPRARVDSLYGNGRAAIGAMLSDWRGRRRRPVKTVGSGAAAIEGFTPLHDDDAAALRWYVYEFGERMLLQALCPGWAISRRDRIAFCGDVDRIDFSKPCWTPPVHALWYYWHGRALARSAKGGMR